MRLPTIPEESSPVCTPEDLPQGIQNNRAKVLLQKKIIVSLEWIPNTELQNTRYDLAGKSNQPDRRLKKLPKFHIVNHLIPSRKKQKKAK